MMIKNRWLIVTILTFLTICVWVVFDILHTRAKVKIPAKTQEVIEPINPQFNTQILDSIQNINEPLATASGSTP